jgi:Trk K+ transport system NAD-binding subunit
MRVLVLGAGLVGTQLAAQLREQGHTVVGTTTTEAKVPAL